jgi:trimeric autotransporter adhesin
MKKLLTLFTFAIIANVLFGQAPSSFNYQAVIRDAAGAVKANANASIRIDLLQGSATGSIIYAESFTVTTNAYGLINLQIGKGNVISGSFSSINWGNNSYFIAVSVDGTLMGTSQLLSVPYALYAKESGGVKSYNDLTDKPTISYATQANLASGYQALQSNDGGGNNTAIGYFALRSNTSGSYNLASGARALNLNTTGTYNTGVGYYSISDNTTGEKNTSAGALSLYSNTTGSSNTAQGFKALYRNTTGHSNVAIGIGALHKSISISNLVAIGDSALFNNGDDINDPFYAINNTAVGSKSLFSNTIGSSNTAIGTKSLTSNTSGSENTAIGYHSLYSNTTGVSNTANGHSALFSNTVGFDNTAIGFHSLYSNISGYRNTAMGYLSFYDNTSGKSNNAVGCEALRSNTTGNDNSAFGDAALLKNTTGKGNIAIGSYALSKNATGDKNVSIGYASLAWNTSWDNTAIGYQALFANTVGFDNVAMGVDALAANATGNGNTAIGKNSMAAHVTGNNNTALGFNANIYDGVSNSTAIGYQATVTSNNKIVLGNATATTVGGYGAWSQYSDRRLKENIVYSNKLGLNFIAQLKPVSYNYTGDSNKRRRDGLIAQDVEQTLKTLGLEFSGLIVDDDKEKTLNLSYAELVIPLINAVQELHQKNQDYETALIEMRTEIARLKQSIQNK